MFIGVQMTQKTFSTPFFMSDASLQALERLGRPRHWKAGEVLAHYGQRLDSVYFCLDGQYRASLPTVDGQMAYLRNLSRGEAFGIPAVLGQVPFPLDVVCEEAGSTLSIERATLENLLRIHPELAMSVIKGLAMRVTEFYDMLEMQRLPTLRARILNCLLRLGQLNGHTDAEGNLCLHLTQQDISSAINASRQKTNLELKRMQSEGMLELGYRQLTLRAHVVRAAAIPAKV